MEKGGRKIIVRGNKVQTLDIFLKEREKSCGKSILTYDHCLKLLHDLEYQNQSLLKESYCIFCIRIEDILVIDGEKFVFVNSDYVKKVDSSGKILFFSPFRRVGVFSPELAAIDVLPSSVEWKTFYYSLGLLIAFCVSGKHVEDKSLLVDSLKHIEKTKLYWSIFRLVAVDPEKRHFLYV